jgi:hypothetical protein
MPEFGTAFPIGNFRDLFSLCLGLLNHSVVTDEHCLEKSCARFVVRTDAEWLIPAGVDGIAKLIDEEPYPPALIRRSWFSQMFPMDCDKLD